MNGFDFGVEIEAVRNVYLPTLDLFEESDVFGRNRELSQVLAAECARFEAHPNVTAVRQTGLIAAMDLVQDKPRRVPYPWQERRGLRVHREALQRGVLLRPLGNVVYFMPPYVITPAEITRMVEVAHEAIDRATTD